MNKSAMTLLLAAATLVSTGLASAQCLDISAPDTQNFVYVPDEFPFETQEFFNFINNGDAMSTIDLQMERISGPDDWIVSLCRGDAFCLPLLSFNDYTVALEDTVSAGVEEYYDILLVINNESFGTGEYHLEIIPQGCPELGIEWDLSITVAEEVSIDLRPRQFALKQNWPNPFNPSTQIPFELRSGGEVSLDVFDITGRLVASPLSAVTYPAGLHNVSFSAGNLSSGVYLYTINTPWGTDAGRMVLAR